MKVSKTEIINLGIIGLVFLIGIVSYPYLPAQVASHWNYLGEIDGYMSKFWGVFLVPFMLMGFWVLFLVVPLIDPQKKNIAKFKIYFGRFTVGIFIFFFYLHLLTLAINLGWQLNFLRFLFPALSGLFYLVGDMLKHTEPNWSIGIRTPWTLSNPEVWRKTHVKGARLFKLCSMIILFGVIWPVGAIFFVLFPIIISVVYLYIYSYFLFKKYGK